MSGEPWFVLVGGINGSGKSTFAQSRDTISALVDVDGHEIQLINPDLVTQEILRASPNLTLTAANKAAAVEQSIERVRHRVSRGGHDVPVDKIRARWDRSRGRLPKYFALATRSFVFANIGKLPQLLAEGDGHFVKYHRQPPKSLEPVLRQLRPEWLHAS